MEPIKKTITDGAASFHRIGGFTFVAIMGGVAYSTVYAKPWLIPTISAVAFFALARFVVNIYHTLYPNSSWPGVVGNKICAFLSQDRRILAIAHLFATIIGLYLPRTGAFIGGVVGVGVAGIVCDRESSRKDEPWTRLNYLLELVRTALGLKK